MGYKLYKFQQLAEMELHLNGAVFGGDPKKGYQIAVGQTLVFIKPSIATVTFTAGAVPGQLSYTEFKTQVQTALSTVKVTAVGDRMAIVENTPSQGVQINASSTCLQGLSMDSAGVTGRYYMYPDGVSAATPPHWIQSYFSEGHYVLVVRE